MLMPPPSMVLGTWQFFEQRERWASEFGMHGCILQMQTGEGKSIVIAMMAIYTVLMLKKKVQPIKNEGLTLLDDVT